MAEQLQPFTVQLSDQDLADLKSLVDKRGLSANTVLRQAIGTEKLIADNVNLDSGDKLLIRKANDTFKEVGFKAPTE